MIEDRGGRGRIYIRRLRTQQWRPHLSLESPMAVAEGDVVNKHCHRRKSRDIGDSDACE